MSSTETITDIEALRELEPEWRALAVGRSNAFISPEWFFAWWRHYGEGLVPFVVVVRDDLAHVRGLLPLAIKQGSRPRVCRIAGSNFGDVFHPAARWEDEAEVGNAVGAALVEARAQWKLFYLDNALGDDWIEGILAGAPIRLSRRLRSRSKLASVQMRDYEHWESYLASRSQKLRSQIRRNGRRLAEQGVSLRRTESQAEVWEDLESFFGLHELRHSAATSRLNAPSARAFHHDFAAAALQTGWLRLWFLEAAGEPIACWYGWRIGESYAHYNGGYDPAWSRYGPGAAMLAAVIEQAFTEDGVEHFDFLLGEEPYKLRFAEPQDTVSSVVMARAGRPASLLASADVGVRRLAGRLPERLGRDSRLAKRLGRLLPGARRA